MCHTEVKCARWAGGLEEPGVNILAGTGASGHRPRERVYPELETVRRATGEVSAEAAVSASGS